MTLSNEAVNIARRSADRLAKTVDPSLQGMIESAIRQVQDGQTGPIDGSMFLALNAQAAWDIVKDLKSRKGRPTFSEVISALEDQAEIPDDLEAPDAFLEILSEVALEEAE